MEIWREKKFTLVEMLVVIAIIGILASLLMPALQSALKSSRQVVCANNLRNLGFGMNDYADANNGYLPKMTWAPLVAPFLDIKTAPFTYVCPEKEFDNSTLANTNLSLNRRLDPTGSPIKPDGNYWLMKLSWVRDPAGTYFIYDARLVCEVYASYPTSRYASTFSDANVDYRHPAGANFLFVDNHAGPVISAVNRGWTPAKD